MIEDRIFIREHLLMKKVYQALAGENEEVVHAILVVITCEIEKNRPQLKKTRIDYELNQNHTSVPVWQ